MSIFSQVESGTSFHRSRFTKSISNRMDYDCQFHQLVPVLKRFVLPGDIWRIGGDVLVRFQPMRTPTLTPNNFRVRYFFVPLRLIEENAELILTGSKDGHLYSGELPVFPSFIAGADKTENPNAYKVTKHDFWDYMNVQCADYESIKNNECLPAEYWTKGYFRILWDYYFDENLSTARESYADFTAYFTAIAKQGCNVKCSYSSLSKDYFTSSLPWQLKGAAPTVFMSGNISLTPNYYDLYDDGTTANNNIFTVANITDPLGTGSDHSVTNFHKATEFTHNDKTYSAGISVMGDSDTYPATAAGRKAVLDDSVDGLNRVLKNMYAESQMGFNGSDLRTMMAQTRIFERLARAGSRYTEYLRANFAISPADGTLQRAQYLGGWKVPIITTEVLQTAEGTDPVGTMRGHGITRGGQRIHTFMAKEFGLLFGIAEVRPDIQYSTGIPRQLTYKRRWDFFNPSLQHLSEQEVRNGELFISESDGKNDDTFGFQAYGNELRTSQNETVGDLRDSLADWNQSLAFSSRPNLNNAFITGRSHRGSFNRPFVVQSADAYPIIVQFYNNLDVYRPMVRYATPGLVDHL